MNRRRFILAAPAVAVAALPLAASGRIGPMIERPAQQLAFAEIIRSTRQRYFATENEIQRADIVKERAEMLRRLLGDSLAFDGWLMQTMMVSQDKAGNGTVMLSAHVLPEDQYSIANIATAEGDPRGQAFRPGSAEYEVARSLNKEDAVFASGVFFADGDKGLLDVAAVMRRPPAAMFRTPLYPVRFTSLRSA